MKRNVLQLTAAFAAVVAFFALMGIAGDIDLCDQVILSMSQEEYDSIKTQLTVETGDTPSDRQIAHWWIENNKE